MNNKGQEVVAQCRLFWMNNDVYVNLYSGTMLKCCFFVQAQPCTFGEQNKEDRMGKPLNRLQGGGDWVSKRTKNKMASIMRAGTLNQATLLLRGLSKWVVVQNLWPPECCALLWAPWGHLYGYWAAWSAGAVSRLIRGEARALKIGQAGLLSTWEKIEQRRPFQS